MIPRFSILTPVFETPAPVLEEMLRSVWAQGFQNWELLLVDDASEAGHIRKMLEAAGAVDSRVQAHFRQRNGGIVAASNDALGQAQGEFVVLLDHDDKLHPEALMLVDEALQAAPEADYAYTDEDNIDERGRHFGGFFKPDWSPERMRTQMYSCHLSVLRRSLVEEVGGFDPEFEGAQDWDLVLKVTERARTVIHVPRVLYHWRALPTSAAGGGEAAKPWAFEAGKNAVQAHCDRTGIQACVQRDPTDPGVYHLDPDLTEHPLVSILIPTRGQSREVRFAPTVLVEHCVRSIVECSTYENYEILIVADADTPAAVLSALGGIAGERLRIVPFDQPFNFSTKVNVGAKAARGEHLLLLNDDIEVATPNWIERMVMYSSIPEVGAVGGRLLLEDGRLQHVVVRFDEGLPGHLYYGFNGDFPGYANEVRVAQNCLSVTGACLMTRRELFESIGGLAEEFPVNYNDVDYCLRLHAAGRRIAYDPDLTMFHFESSSRSSDVAEWEKQLLRQRWLPLTASDPYSNPNLREGMPRISARFAWARRRPRLPRRPQPHRR